MDSRNCGGSVALIQQRLLLEGRKTPSSRAGREALDREEAQTASLLSWGPTPGSPHRRRGGPDGAGSKRPSGKWSPVVVLSDGDSSDSRASADGGQHGGPTPLDAALEECVQQRLYPDGACVEERWRIIRWLEGALQRELPGSKLVPFGSFVMDLTTRSGDLDLSLEPPPVHPPSSLLLSPLLPTPSPLDTPTRDQKLDMLRQAMRVVRRLQKDGSLRSVELISRAAVPVLKFTHAASGVECDISVANRDGAFKSTVIALLNRIDPRFRPLCFLIKAWARRAAINDPKTGSLNSLSLLLLCTVHLQTRSPPILPPLKDIMLPGLTAPSPLHASNSTSLVLGWLNQCEANVERLRAQGFGSTNNSSVAHLLATFFCNMAAQEKSWQQGLCASAFHGQWTFKPFANEKHDTCMGVEDFLDLESNCARGVRGTEFRRILHAFRDAASTFRDSPGSLSKARSLCSAFLFADEAEAGVASARTADRSALPGVGAPGGVMEAECSSAAVETKRKRGGGEGAGRDREPKRSRAEVHHWPHGLALLPGTPVAGHAAAVLGGGHHPFSFPRGEMVGNSLLDRSPADRLSLLPLNRRALGLHQPGHHNWPALPPGFGHASLLPVGSVHSAAAPHLAPLPLTHSHTVPLSLVNTPWLRVSPGAVLPPPPRSRHSPAMPLPSPDLSWPSVPTHLPGLLRQVPSVPLYDQHAAPFPSRTPRW